MLSQEQSITLIKEIVAGSDRGDFQKISDIPDSYTYEHLAALFALKGQLDGGELFYRQVYHLAMARGEAHLRRKAGSGERIQVAFLTYSAALWPAKNLYRDMEADERFHPCVIVPLRIGRDGTSIVTEYNQTLQWFRKNGFEVIGGLTDRILGWNELGGVPDLVIHSSSDYECIPPKHHFLQLPWRCLNLYAPVGLFLQENSGHTYAKDIISDRDFFSMMWRICAGTEFERKQYEEYGLLEGENVLSSGLLKADALWEKLMAKNAEAQKNGEAQDPDVASDTEWKYPEHAAPSKCKRVIISPMGDLQPESEGSCDTFFENAFFWIYLAKKYQDSVTFLFRPHPDLRYMTVKGGLFASHEAYDAYLEQWNSLPNARVMSDPEEADAFRSSDVMITDDVSCAGEYLVTRKPVLYLTRPQQKFNALGEKLLEATYRAPGKRYAEIERFLTEVVLKGQDTMQEQRDTVCAEYLNYRSGTGKFAHEIVMEEIERAISGM